MYIDSVAHFPGTGDGKGTKKGVRESKLRLQYEVKDSSTKIHKGFQKM
jgi:hypothetical protein